ncbi:DNA primase [Comamonas serinivorans]|uniref:DNA primase n=1 Tax=Comamonas serinivorans TaxID=1082851 RepID=A0A1Y0ETW2_9BURK|nr:DNA primase [Comamonas serinivorans]ARU06841.1 DNA primase [Comamonas serinivorans]
MAIPQGFIDDLLARTDVVEVVGRHVQLKRAGANYQGLCPFHSEKSPSFTVSPSKQFYHCFGCGKSGNAIGFLMDHLGSGFVETVQDLAQQAGLTVPQEQVSPQEMARQQAQREQRKTLTEVLEQAAQAYRERLRTTPLAIDYLKKRGLSGAIAQRFGLGYAPDTWRGLASVFAAYDDPLLEHSGLVIHNAEEDKRYDRFRGRVMFPIRNERGECIGFGGRVLGDEKPKYLNSPETPVFSKGHELYGLYEARNAIRDAGHVLVTEGYMDVVALAQLGLPNAVATLGTACTPDHMTKLFRVTDQVVFSFDGDAAGRRAAHKALHVALPLATDVRTVKFLFLPAEHDPDSFVRTQGKAAFDQAVQQAVPLSRFVMDVASETLDLETAEGRAQTAVRAGELWRLLPQGTLAQQMLGDLASLVRMEAAQLLESWQRQGLLGKGRPGRGEAPARPTSPSIKPSPFADERKHDHTAHPPGSDWSQDLGGFDSWPTAESTWPQDGHGAWPGARHEGRESRDSRSSHGGRGERGAFRNDRGNRFKGKDTTAGKRWQSHSGPPGMPTPRSEHAARLLLAQMELWATLSETEHSLLCEQPAPVGPLIRWLDRQFQDHGTVAWGVLVEQLQGQPFADFASQLMRTHKDLTAPQANFAELESEMRSIMFGIRRDACAAQETRAALANDIEGLKRAKLAREELDRAQAAWAAQRAAS